MHCSSTCKFTPKAVAAELPFGVKFTRNIRVYHECERRIESPSRGSPFVITSLAEAVLGHTKFLIIYLRVDKIFRETCFAGRKPLKRPYASWKNIG